MVCCTINLEIKSVEITVKIISQDLKITYVNVDGSFHYYSGYLDPWDQHPSFESELLRSGGLALACLRQTKN